MQTDHILNLELPHGCGSFVTPMALTHSVYPIRKVEEQAPKPVDWTRCFLLMLIWKLISCLMFDIHISQVILLHNEEQGF